MVYTVTFNSAIDYVVHTGEMKLGATNRSVREEMYFGGKGINVSIVLRELGIVSKALGCSTQPIMSHYATVRELRADIYAKADEFHSEYLMRIPEDSDPMLSIGMNYIRFAVEEKYLFRFLFQSDKLWGSFWRARRLRR